MNTNILGIRNNNTIIPLTATTRQTKEVALTVTSAQAGWATDRATGIFYCDSSATPVWRLRFNVSGTFNSASVQTITAAITGVVFKSTVGQAIAANFPVANSTVRAFANGNTGDLVASMASAASTTNVTYSGDVELNADPTTYTTAANMEGVVAVDVFVPSAAAGIQGLVDNRVENTLGTPILGKTAAGAVAAGYVGEELEAIATVATNTSGNSFNVASKALTAGTWLVSGHLRATMKTSFAVFQGAIGTTSATGEEIRASSGQHMGGAVNGEYRSIQLCPKIVNTTGATIYLNSICIGANDCSITGTLNCVRIA